MTNQRYEARRQRRIHEGFVTLDVYEATITADGRTVKVVREVHDHGNGACVLPYDPERRTAILVRQLRVPVHVATGEGLFLEAAAGVIDPDDPTPTHAAQREAREELGYEIHDITPIGTVFTIPGMVTERMFCHLATYGPADRLEGDTGADEDEVIDVEEWSLDALWQSYLDGTLSDVKAVFCLMRLRLDQPQLFAPTP